MGGLGITPEEEKERGRVWPADTPGVLEMSVMALQGHPDLGAEAQALHTPCSSALRSSCPGRGRGLGTGLLICWEIPSGS